MNLGAIKIFATYICLLMIASTAKANTADVDVWLSVYPTSQSYANFNCNICHMNIAQSTNLNAYGNAYRNAGRGIAGSFVAIQGADSDADGSSNLVEVTAGSNPGSNASTPGNLPTAGSGGDNGTLTIGSDGSNEVLDYANANMLNQTSCGTIATDSSDDGNPPPGALLLVLLPVAVLFGLRKSTREYQH